MNIDQLKKIIPKAGQRAGVFIGPLNDAMDEFHIDTPERQAAFIAQIAHESCGLLYTREIASGAAYDGRADLGNTRFEAISTAAKNGTSPGRFWRGRGLIQITGYDNYVECSEALGIDCVEHPEFLEGAVNACRSAAWFWWHHGLNAFADQRNFMKITRIINGGLNGQPERLAFYDRAKGVLQC